MSNNQAIVKTGREHGSRRFTERLNGFLRRVEHRCACTQEDVDLVFSTRYKAYRRQNIIERRDDHWLFDPEYDLSTNAFLTMTSVDNAFVSTFRVHVAQDFLQPLPSRGVFGDLIDPYLAAGLTVVDPTRLAARLEASRAYPELPFVALRPAWLAAEHFDADIVLATVSAEHTPFYERVFGYRAISAPRAYPDVRFKIVCLALEYAAVKSEVEARYPFLRSSEAERRALFGGLAADRETSPGLARVRAAAERASVGVIS